ncbi:MAG: hypothetical protein AAGC72_06545 [Planctomycetota bacterium]
MAINQKEVLMSPEAILYVTQDVLHHEKYPGFAESDEPDWTMPNGPPGRAELAYLDRAIQRIGYIVYDESLDRDRLLAALADIRQALGLAGLTTTSVESCPDQRPECQPRWTIARLEHARAALREWERAAVDIAELTDQPEIMKKEARRGTKKLWPVIRKAIQSFK